MSASPSSSSGAPLIGYREIAAAGTATGWFETLYAEARAGRAEVPWDVPEASAHLRDFPLPAGDGRRALVVGCGAGRDAEHLAAAGYETTAFDIAPTAIELARSRHAGSPVSYVVADLLDPPAGWHHAFDLVLESNNLQALPAGLRARAIPAVGTFVAPGGTLLVLAAAAVAGEGDGPPWPLTREEIDAFAADGLRQESVEHTATPDTRFPGRWRAVFRR
ncbi:class I SAM-dependent methyltransferase [Actinoplanes sp. GCM10030250]|uniref:class I SAM-dependent methyltransferase n=1 Tax=Actinoplanes sp. GCM10030250 TaxID=3273376 RepID=UPI0036219E60